MAISTAQIKRLGVTWAAVGLSAAFVAWVLPETLWVFLCVTVAMLLGYTIALAFGDAE